MRKVVFLVWALKFNILIIIYIVLKQMGICKSKTSKGKFHSIFDNKKNEEN